MEPSGFVSIVPGLAPEARNPLVGLEHGTGLPVIHQQRPEAALGDVRWECEAVAPCTVEVLGLLSRIAYMYCEPMPVSRMHIAGVTPVAM